MAKDMKIMIGAEQVMYSNISRSKDGYNSARVVAKINEKEYMSVSYEWEGSGVPEFAMNLMSFMQANDLQLGEKEELSSEYDIAKAKKGVNPFVKKDKDMEDEEDPKDKKNTDKKSMDKKKKAKSAKKMCGGCGKTKAECNCDGGFMPEPEDDEED